MKLQFQLCFRSSLIDSVYNLSFLSDPISSHLSIFLFSIFNRSIHLPHHTYKDTCHDSRTVFYIPSWPDGDLSLPWLPITLLLAASDHGVVTVDLPRSARAPLRSGAHLTLYMSHDHPPSRVCSLEGKALLFCGIHCA